MTAPRPLLLQPACFFPINSFKKGFVLRQTIKCILFSSTALKKNLPKIRSSHQPNNLAQISRKLLAGRRGAGRNSGAAAGKRSALPAREVPEFLRRDRPRRPGRWAAGPTGSRPARSVPLL